MNSARAYIKTRYARTYQKLQKKGSVSIKGKKEYIIDHISNTLIKATDEEIEAIKDYSESLGSEAIVCKHWAHGSQGTQELATRVAAVADSGISKFTPLYPDEMPLFEKIETIAKHIYRADEVLADDKIREQLRLWEAAGYAHLPVCMAKTQYSFSTDPSQRGAPTGHSVPIREVRLSAGAGFVVVV